MDSNRDSKMPDIKNIKSEVEHKLDDKPILRMNIFEEELKRSLGITEKNK